MDKALYTAMTGAAASLRSQAAVSHNLANVSTVGFKAALVNTEAFKINGNGQGLPTRFATVPTDEGFDASQGPLQVTGNALDVALHENVWLAVTDSAGQEAFTKAGELRLNSNGLMTTVDGKQVLGVNGPIAVPPSQELLIGADGSISIVPQGQTPATLAQVSRLKLVQAEPGQLQRGEDGLFRPQPGVTPNPAPGVALTSGALEGSNVNAASALVQMIELQRAFETQVKVIKTSEENARQSASLMRLS